MLLVHCDLIRLFWSLPSILLYIADCTNCNVSSGEMAYTQLRFNLFFQGIVCVII
jgi:hypothetical protein